MLRKPIFIAISVILACTLSLRAQDDENRALVLKAIQATGGKETITKFKAIQTKFKGDVDVAGTMTKVEGEVFINHSGQLKNIIDVSINNMNIKITQAFDGKNAWMDVLGMLTELKDKDLIQEMHETMHSEEVANLIALEKKEFKLSAIGEAKVKGKEAVGVRVSKEGRRDVNLWFDKKTHLLVKTERRGKDPFDPNSTEANREKYYADYKAVQGIQTPHAMEVHTDGKKLISMELMDTRYHERPFGDSTFAKP
jgi:hypothetical protein